MWADDCTNCREQASKDSVRPAAFAAKNMVTPVGPAKASVYRRIYCPTRDGSGVDFVEEYRPKSNRAEAAANPSLDAAGELRSIARAIRRISPDHSDPERFFLAKEVAAERLVILARAVERSA